MAHIRARHWLWFSFVAVACLFGCGKQRLPTKVVFGTVTYRGQNVDRGQVRFVPINGTSGPASVSLIVDGQYRIDARGGVPVGKHRIEVDARKRTGRKVLGSTGAEMGEIDETVQLVPPSYGTSDSPLVREVTTESDGRIDIEIPSR